MFLLLPFLYPLSPEGIILIGLDDFSTFIRQLYHITMRIFYIILFFRGAVYSFIGINQINSTDIPLPYLATVREFHYQLIPVPDKNCFFSIHSLASTQSLGIVSIVYLIHLSVTVPRAPWSLLYASPPKLVSYHFRWQVTTALR